MFIPEKTAGLFSLPTPTRVLRLTKPSACFIRRTAAVCRLSSSWKNRRRFCRKMWICPKCQNENEENFRFCWGCGLTRLETKVEPEINIPVESPRIETPEPPEPVKREIVKNNPEPKDYRKIDETEDVLP